MDIEAPGRECDVTRRLAQATDAFCRREEGELVCLEDWATILWFAPGCRVWRDVVVGAHALSVQFTQPTMIAQLGLPPYRVDILTSISGVLFDDAWPSLVSSTIEGVDVPVLGLDAFIRNKRASGRTKDLADLEALGVK
jgi:hypothetical protein